MKRILACLAMSIAFSVPLAWAQPEEAPPPQGESDMPSMPMQQGDEARGMGERDVGEHGMGERGMGAMGSMMPMHSMSESMKAMADMCRHMMQREMAMRPYKMAALAIFGLLLLVSLILLIVLQVQWIKYWKRRLSNPQIL